MSREKALCVNGFDRLTSATAIELDKQFRLNALGDVCPLDMLPANAIVFDAHVYKLKADGRETCRIAVMGNRIPPAMDEQTFASVISDGAKIFSIAAMQTHCDAHREALIISDCDVVGGFLHIPLNSPVPMFLHLPLTFLILWQENLSASLARFTVSVRAIVSLGLRCLVLSWRMLSGNVLFASGLMILARSALLV